MESLQHAAERAGIDLIFLANPSRWVSNGLNACIERAQGDLIVRLDCHSRYPSDYVRRCAQAAEETGALNVGGVVTPVGQTGMERAVACAMDSPFGGIGWTRHGAVDARAEVDTVTYGAFRPQAFQLAGRFDESLVRNQDDEFNLRLRLAGGGSYSTPRSESGTGRVARSRRCSANITSTGSGGARDAEASQSTRHAQSCSDRVRVFSRCPSPGLSAVRSRAAHECRGVGSRCLRRHLVRREHRETGRNVGTYPRRPRHSWPFTGGMG